MSEERTRAPQAPDRAGRRLGGYEIRAKLGAGGMGEVYRARDTRLDRDVALKILPEEFASDPGRVRRFEGEARAASALNHPNIVTVYEVGSADAHAYIAMELVEGKTLREALAAGPLALKKLLDVACQIASGLARAHEAGIVHRDLKPDNVMVSRDGLVKILDFGLAKRMPFEGDAGSVRATVTQEGSVVGTVGYMSPEQASGQSLDFRSDQFSFGSILYEMATGKRAFQSKSAVETLAAIINAEPEPIEKTNPRFPVPLRWIVGRCLAKEPAARYASTQDLAQELRVVRDHWTELSDTSAAAFVAAAPRRLRLFAAVAAASVLAGFFVVFFAGRRAGERPIPDFQRLTYRHGIVVSARFAPDGRTIVYGAAWGGAPIRLFSTRTDGRDSNRLDLGDADVVSVSSAGEIAMLLGRPLSPITRWVGTLAQAPLSGGAPRELTEGVADADWSPDGKSLAIVRQIGNIHRLEFPIGKVLYETKGWIEYLRFSPGGDRIGFLVRDADVSIETVDLAGKHRVLTRGWKRGSGLAWSADGSEIWFGANEREWRTPLYAVTLKGKVRLLMRLPTWIRLQDVSRDGQTLVSFQTLRSNILGVASGETQEKDLSWHEGSMVKSLTPDGKTMLFDEGSEGYFHTVYVRPMDGSPAKRIGEGRALAISPDGQWVAANVGGRGSQTVLMPTGAGEPKALGDEGHRFEEAAFFPGGKRILLLAVDPGHADRSYVKDLQTGKMRAVAPEGISCQVVSPDGTETACTGPHGEGAIYSVEGGTSRPIPGFQTGREDPLMWSADGRSLYVGPVAVPQRWDATLRVFRLDLATGKRELWHEFTPADLTARLAPLYNFAMTSDGKSYAYSFLNGPSDLYLVTGLK
jgi:eukaryotic-like serine/threonine-protein kinase